jgi:hypothetical protein
VGFELPDKILVTTIVHLSKSKRVKGANTTFFEEKQPPSSYSLYAKKTRLTPVSFKVTQDGTSRLATAAVSWRPEKPAKKKKTTPTGRAPSLSPPPNQKSDRTGASPNPWLTYFAANKHLAPANLTSQAAMKWCSEKYNALKESLLGGGTELAGGDTEEGGTEQAGGDPNLEESSNKGQDGRTEPSSRSRSRDRRSTRDWATNRSTSRGRESERDRSMSRSRSRGRERARKGQDRRREPSSRNRSRDRRSTRDRATNRSTSRERESERDRSMRRSRSRGRERERRIEMYALVARHALQNSQLNELGRMI